MNGPHDKVLSQRTYVIGLYKPWLDISIVVEEGGGNLREEVLRLRCWVDGDRRSKHRPAVVDRYLRAVASNPDAKIGWFHVLVQHVVERHPSFPINPSRERDDRVRHTKR